MLKKLIAVENMRHLVNHDWHGYSQVSRWGDGEGFCIVDLGVTKTKLAQGDRDCSSSIISAYEAAGISCGGATYTGNMRSCMVGTVNFKWHPMGDGYVAQAGDVYLNESCHTAMCLSAVPDMLMEFSISETGGIDGAEGDQTGWESHICAYYNYPWDGILECINKEEISTSGSWILDTIGWWYKNADGTYPKSCWKKLDTWYYFNERGYAVHDDWVYYKNKWYYLKSDCRMATGWIKVKGYWYYLNESGAMLEGWQKINNCWYYLRKETDKDTTHPYGSMVVGLFDDCDYTYYCREKAESKSPTGSMVTGWLKLDTWYYFNESSNCQPKGSMMKNHWVSYNAKKYYMKNDGKMACNETLEIGGKKYKFDNTGALK